MAKPKLCLIPSAQGDKFYSVLPSSGVGDFDFTRSGGATRINSQGLIETVADGVSRLNYPLIDGKVVGCPSHILEPQRTNLVQYSEDFSQSYWNKTNSLIESNNTISPNGSLNASKLKEDVSNGNHNIYSNDVSVTIGSEYTFSLYVKKAERSIIRIDGGYRLTLDVTFNLDTFSVNGDGTIESLPNDWYKLTANGVGEISNGGTNIFIFLINDNGVQSYQGDGTSGIYIWGAMLEQSSFPTSYIPNYGTALGVTRSAETANNSGDASTFNDSEGVLMFEGGSLSELDVTARYIQMSDGTSTPNGIQLRYYTSTNSFQALYYTNSAYQAVLSYTLPNSSENNKIAFKYKENDFALWVNGVEVATDLNGITGASLSKLKFDYNNFSDFYGNTKQIQYFDSADIDLETLTSWVSFSDMAEGQLYSVE